MYLIELIALLEEEKTRRGNVALSGVQPPYRPLG